MNFPLVKDERAKESRARAAALRVPLMPSLERRRLQCYLALMISDLVSLFAGLALAGYLYLHGPGLSQALVLGQLLQPVYLTVALYNGAYSHAALGSNLHSVTRAVMALVVSSSVLLFIIFYTKSSAAYSRVLLTFGMALATGMLAFTRVQMRRFVRWRCGAAVENVLVIDDGGPPLQLPGACHVSAAAFGLKPVLDDPHALDRIGLVLRNADRAVISTPAERREDWAIILKGANIAGEVIDETVARLSAQGARQAGGRGLLLVSVGPLGLRDRFVKRALDVAVAGSALLVLAPLLLLVAVAIRLEDGGPVMFVQRRVGRANRFFPICKFRSMSVNRAGRDGARSATRTDARVTRVGRLIRSTSIDELPQLLNVLKGDMSLVGPRPHAIASVAGEKLFWEVDARYWERHALKPGVTGLAQIRGLRGATECEEDLAGRLNADLEYLNGWTIWRDLWIILATFRVLAHDRAF